MARSLATDTPGQRLILATILIGYLALAVIYSLVTPLFEASDELWHYPMVKYVADHRFGLPIQDPANPGPWGQEGSQPPLYYFIGAAATLWIDTSDLADVRRLNPHVDIGVVVPDGNANMVVHSATREGFPWSGTALAMHIVRFLSVLMGLGTVYLTYRLGRELFPARPAIALAAAAFTAFNPMFLFISGVINNDNLSTLLASLLLVLAARLVRGRGLPPARDYVVLGVAAGAGMLAKFQIGFMLPLIALALALVARRERDWHPLVIGGAIAGGLTIAIAGWWYWRNYRLYGDATGINIFLDIVGRRQVPADLRQLWTEREAFMMAFWGFFGGVNVPMPGWTYRLFNLIAGMAAAGLLAALGRQALHRARGTLACPERSLLWARAFAALWPVIIFLSLLSWTRQTWASQGRLWFSAIAALSVWMAAGLAGWAPRWTGVQRAILTGAASIFVVLAALVPLITIAPAYAFDPHAAFSGPTHELPGRRAVCWAEPDDARPVLCAAAQPVGGEVQPGEYVRFAPTFTTTGRLTRDWSLFVHLVSADGIIEAQRDVYPGGGKLATSEIARDTAWNNPIAVRVPAGLYTPQTLDVYLGLYDLKTGDRMVPSGDGSDPAHNRVHLGQVRLVAPPGEIPNPIGANFDSRLRLLGYTVDDRSLAPGETATVTLYWQAPRRLSEDFVISVQVIDPVTLTKAAQLDAQPQPPTSAWSPGETIIERRPLTIFDDVPPGRYRLMVRVYPSGAPGEPLRVRGDAGAQSEDFVWLSWMQVE